MSSLLQQQEEAVIEEGRAHAKALLLELAKEKADKDMWGYINCI